MLGNFGIFGQFVFLIIGDWETSKPAQELGFLAEFITTWL